MLNFRHYLSIIVCITCIYANSICELPLEIKPDVEITFIVTLYSVASYPAILLDTKCTGHSL